MGIFKTPSTFIQNFQNQTFMKKLFTVTGLLLVISLSAQKAPVKPASSATSPVKLTSVSDTVQYTLGTYLGQWMIKNGFIVSNGALFTKGLDDALQGKTPTALAANVDQRVANYQQISMLVRGRAQEQQLFVALKSTPGVGTLPDGVNYIVQKNGTGIRPVAADSVVLNMRGVLLDGTLFEDTYQKKAPVFAIAGDLIPGISETIQMMPEGSQWKLFIPAALAYGERGTSGVIPPNSALIMEVELVKVKQAKR